MPERGEDAPSVLQLLDDVGSPATMATAGPRYFGYVVDGALPPTVAANWLAAAWDQNVGLFLASPVGAHLEQVILEWLLDSLELPRDCGGAFVTRAQMQTSRHWRPRGCGAAERWMGRRKEWSVRCPDLSRGK
jgi:glutamate/tyrosine decarboxylase-like PLP-dependent enzyme